MKLKYQPVTAAELKNVVGPRPGTRALNDVLVWHYANRGVKSGGIYNKRPVRGLKALSPSSASLHAAGRAVDIMVPNKQVGDEIYLRVVAAADAIGVCEVIWWERRITASGERPYKGVSPHRDHLHIGMVADIADRANDQNLKNWMSYFLFKR